MDDILLERVNELEFVVRQPYVVDKDADDFQFHSSSAAQSAELQALFSRCSNECPPPLIENFPFVISSYSDLPGLRKASLLSDSAKFQEVTRDPNPARVEGEPESDSEAPLESTWEMTSEIGRAHV